MNSHDTNAAHPIASGSRSAAPDLPALQAASHLIHEQLTKDAQIIPDLGDMLTIPGGQSSVSYTVYPGDYRVPFQKRKHIGIPPALWEHFQSSKFVCHMGLMTEIERAWITLDHKLFLWDYVEGQELSSFIEQPETITHVALVRPRPGVFVEEIAYLLVICTPVTVLLLGLSATSSTGPSQIHRKEIKLYATDISVSTDGVEMSSVVGTGDGRIFMCGVGDGNLYELHYQEKEVWFGKKYHLINHSANGLPSFIPLLRTAQTEERIICLVVDNERNFIYSLSEQNWISVWKPQPNKGLQKIQTLSNLNRQAQDRAPGAPALVQGIRLLSLHVIDSRESRTGVQLMALSSNGVRLYFSPAPNAGYGAYGFAPHHGPGDSRQLHLLHVRLPPANLLHPDEQFRPQRMANGAFGTSAQTQQTMPTCIVKELTNASYVDGLLVAAQPSDVDGKDFILGISPDLSRTGNLGQTQPQASSQGPPQMSYYASTATTGYYAQPIAPRTPLTEQATLLYIEGTIWAIASSQPAGVHVMSPEASMEPLATNELATQFSQPRQEFIIVTNVGISYLVKRRALDYLYDTLEEVHAEGSLQPILDFKESFGRNQTCAMLLALASGNKYLAAERDRSSVYDDVVTLSPEIAAIAKQMFYELGDRPLWIDRGMGADQGSIHFSGRREGLNLYFARLVRPIWRAKVTKTGPSGQGTNFDDSVLIVTHRNLNALKNFLDRNPQLFSTAPGDHTTSNKRQNVDQDAWKIEQTSAAHLHALLHRTVEAISFVLLLIDYHFGELVAQCDKNTQTILSTMTFEDLITTDKGLHISRALVNVIIDSQIGQHISIDTVSDILQQRCGSFCSGDDVMLYKARESVRNAADIKDPSEKQVLLGESLRLFLRAARIVDFEKLRAITGDYQHLNYTKGIIELPLRCAAFADEDNTGLSYWAEGLPANDPRADALMKRQQCYDLILHSLSVFDEQCSKEPLRQDFEEVRNHAYDLAFSSEDPAFHSHLYEWMVQRGMTDTLLEIRPPFLESHLLREPASADKYQLLWQLYVKNGQYLRAAEVLATLAQSQDFALSLDARIEYLTLAVSNAKSHPVTAAGKHETAIAFLTELEDQLEVAQVQMELRNALVPHSSSPEVGQQISILQQRLFNITELYQLYAEPFNLPLIKLLILRVSEHHDEAIAKAIWNELIDEASSVGSPDQQAERISSVVITQGRRFYPSENAFPLRHIAFLLIQFCITNRGSRPYGWSPRVLKECGVTYAEIWDIFHEMYESQVSPFNIQENVQLLSSDIAVLLKDWVEDTSRSQSALSRDDFPADLLDRTVTKYIEELTPDRKDTKALYEDVKRMLRRYW